MREGFIHKLHCGLKSMELPMSYISILSLLGAESNTKTKAQVHPVCVEMLYYHDD